MSENSDLSNFRFIRKQKGKREKKPLTDYQRRYKKLTEKIRTARHPLKLEYYTALREDLRLSKSERDGSKKQRERRAKLLLLKLEYQAYIERHQTRDGAESTISGPQSLIDFR